MQVKLKILMMIPVQGHKIEQTGSVNMSNDIRTIKIGSIYRHFKGNLYRVEGIAKHSENCEEFVVYRQMYGDGSLWIRPLSMFLEEVDRVKYPDAVQKYRFELIE